MMWFMDKFKTSTDTLAYMSVLLVLTVIPIILIGGYSYFSTH